MNDDQDTAHRLLRQIEQEQHYGNEQQADLLAVLLRIEANQKRELESIRFNTGWCFYALICILISVTAGLFWG